MVCIKYAILYGVFFMFQENYRLRERKISMKRFKRGLAILLSTCMIGGMMPITTSAQESVSGNTVQTEDTAISAIQELIDALPDADSITEDSAEEVTAQLDAIDEAKAELADEKLAQLDLTRYDAAAAKMMALMGMEGAEQPMAITLAQDSNGFYQINSAEDLQAFASLVNSGTKDAKAILTQDIDCSGLSDFTPIGTQANPFAGTFNGNSHAIKNLTINTPNADYVGLFGYIKREKDVNTGAVYSLGIEGGSFTGKSYVGSVFGYGSNVRIVNCYTTAQVNGQSNAGVFAGCHTDGGQIKCCYAAGTALGSTKLFTGYILDTGNTYEYYCYYLSDITETSIAAKPTTSDQFHSGYLIASLNEGQSNIPNTLPKMSWGRIYQVEVEIRSHALTMRKSIRYIMAQLDICTIMKETNVHYVINLIRTNRSRTVKAIT